MREPEGLATLRDASAGSAQDRPLDPRLGAWARALAAAKPGTALLHLCESRPEMALWIRSGMDLGSRLVVVVPGPEGKATLERAIGSDLRITCHRQSPDAFLDDVRSHRFGLIVHDAAACDPARIDRLWEVLSPGGLLLICGRDPLSEAPASGPPHADAVADLIAGRRDAALARHAGLEGTLLAARMTPPPPAVRRGGRRARREPGAVTALRPRARSGRAAHGGLGSLELASHQPGAQRTGARLVRARGTGARDARVHKGDQGSQYLSIPDNKRQVEAGIKPSAGHIDDSYADALVESIIGVHEVKATRCCGRGRG